ncbi:hypothetical protein GCM10009557_30460 [Virgisporangium ochraceum]|jgi:hypothetical protein|uniref:DUF3558 domain-containing protein n=1 Tax=Virgisporangium ochraceum TaxID=65505 RepID=A0A8J3ZSS2_9ACTN|nr:DUF3558 family protein [Virgisporangium ochraceum]GIJ68358.1 hypothetical protein Voc01_032750 [Virgisporangium ochraceum]
MRVRTAVVVAAACGLFALSGCQLLEKDEDPAAAPTPAASTTTSAKATPTSKATGGAKSGDLPNPCTLLTKAEVSTISGGKAVTQIDEDGEKDGATTRYCQWQLSGGQLAIFLSKSSASEFKQAHGQQQKVTGVGDDARQADGHLYVLHGDIVIDAYARSSGNEAATTQMAKNAALKVIDKL